MEEVRGSSPLLPTIDTRRQGSHRLFGGLRCGSVLTLAYPQADMTARNYAVFLYAKKPCFIAFLTGLLVFLLYILTFGCSSILHYALRDLNLVPFLLLVFLLIVRLVSNLITPQIQVLIKILFKFCHLSNNLYYLASPCRMMLST